MFVSALGGLPRIVTVHDVALRADAAGLRLELVAKTYRNPSSGGQSTRPSSRGRASSMTRWPCVIRSSRAPCRSVTYPAGPRSHRTSGVPAVPGRYRRRPVRNGRHAVPRRADLRSAACRCQRPQAGGRRLPEPDHGRVTAIDEGHVELLELFPDEQGAWLERPRTLVLNVNS